METPRNLALILTAVAAITAAIAGFIGFRLANQPPQQIIVHFEQMAK